MLEKSIRAIQFIAKPAVKLTTTLAKKVAEQAVPRTVEFAKTWQREWDKDASSIKPTIIQPQPKPKPKPHGGYPPVQGQGATTAYIDSFSGEKKCNMCDLPWDLENNHCSSGYKCWK